MAKATAEPSESAKPVDNREEDPVDKSNLSALNFDTSNSDYLKLRSNNSFHHVRYLIIVLGGLACGCMFLMRLSVTVAMLSMVNHTHLYLVEDPTRNLDDYFEPGYVEVGEFNWNNEIQQFLIAGYMIAYTFPQYLTTKMAKRHGIRRAIPISLTLCSLSCLLTPILAYWGWGWMLFLRLLNGVGASAILPSMIGTIEIWMPLKDSAQGLALLQFVQTILLICTPLVSGILASLNWKWAFFVPGALGLVYAFIWWILVRDDPDHCSYVSQKEYDTIKELKSVENNSTMSDNDRRIKAEEKPVKTDLPWYFMFKIGSFYGFMSLWCLYCATFGGFMFLIPSYFNRVLKLAVEENGFYNFIIQLGIIFSMLWPNPLTKYLQNRFKISLTTARRIIVFIYTFMSVVTWSYVAAFHNHQIIAICINRFFHMTNDTIITSTLMSQFGKEGLSSEVYSMMNTVGNLASVLYCWLAGRFLDATGESIECWTWFFVSLCGLNVLLLLIYLIFMKSEPITVKRPNNKEEEIC